MYVATRDKDEQMGFWGVSEEDVTDNKEGKDYAIAFLFIFMAMVGPYII